jgi:cell division cycle 20-like protein 1 (cofactor of APC complex)
VKKQK